MSGDMAENVSGFNVANDVGSAEKVNVQRTEVLRPKIQWRSKQCLNVAVIRPVTRSGSCDTSQTLPQSPALTSSISPARTNPDDLSPQARSSHMFRRNCTQMCPFSFDLRDSMQRVAQEQKLERLRLKLMEERHRAFTFRANPVRKYKPLVLQQSSRQLTIPRSPFSSGHPCE
ncbi:siaz-interacting nuclear protein [Tachysurus vachellii]|uniref:siaz-interacting nuclear protein n=1 Tax=Tachysurus vachellii TaxID=175792 RepID=UPI00296B0401|nr:siaz-interacting nuclear protein [Tachysurus vachellii]